MEIAVDIMHPIERLEFHPEYVGEKFDLRFDVRGHQCEVMYTIELCHVIDLLLRKRSLVGNVPSDIQA